MQSPVAPARPFLVCVHDATPAYARETHALIRKLAPLVGRRVSFGVVPNWRGNWPLAAHPEFCHLVEESSDELLLHGYFHQRNQGRGPVTLLAEGSDEMNGLDAEATRRVLVRGQRDFIEVFGEPARGFLAPAWQRGHAWPENATGLEHVLGFFSVESRTGSIPLSTWTWDCGRLSFLGHVGHAIGSLSHSLNRGVPALAIHPRDVERGFWPKIAGITRRLLENGYQPTTVAALFEPKLAS